MVNYDVNSISDKIIKQLQPLIVSPDFQVKKIENVSQACKAICMWVHAMYNYYQVPFINTHAHTCIFMKDNDCVCVFVFVYYL